MTNAVGELSNREIALLIWLAIFVIVVISRRDLRATLGPLLRMIFLSKLTLSLLAMVGYMALVVLALLKLGFWEWWMLKDAVFWFFGSAVILFLNSTTAVERDHYFRQIALDNLKFAVVLDFVLNLYVFDLLIELLFLPLLVVLALLSAVAGTKAQFSPAKKLSDALMTGIGIALLVYAVTKALTGFHGFATAKNLDDFLVPILLTILLLPFAYLFGLWSAYETLLARINIWFRKDSELGRYARRQVIKACRLRPGEVRRFSKEFVNRFSGRGSVAEVDALMAEFRCRREAGS